MRVGREVEQLLRELKPSVCAVFRLVDLRAQSRLVGLKAITFFDVFRIVDQVACPHASEVVDLRLILGDGRQLGLIDLRALRHFILVVFAEVFERPRSELWDDGDLRHLALNELLQHLLAHAGNLGAVDVFAFSGAVVVGVVPELPRALDTLGLHLRRVQAAALSTADEAREGKLSDLWAGALPLFPRSFCT